MTPPLVLAYERVALTTTLMTCHYQKLAVLLIELKQISLAAKPIRSAETVEFSQNILETNSEQFKEGVSSKVSQVIVGFGLLHVDAPPLSPQNYPF